MTDHEHFQVVLSELGNLVVALKAHGFVDEVVLIGAQVVALEQGTRAEELFELTTAHGTRLTRGFSFEPDLVLDTDDEQKLDAYPAAFAQCGFKRVHQAGRPATWSKRVADVTVDIDLFSTASDDSRPSGMPSLRGVKGRRCHELKLPDNVSILVPDAITFLSMKLEAKLRIRPEKTKDSFDMLAYVLAVGPESVREQLKTNKGNVGQELRGLFGVPTAAGVLDVVNAGLPHGTAEERAQVAQFNPTGKRHEELCRHCHARGLQRVWIPSPSPGRRS